VPLANGLVLWSCVDPLRANELPSDCCLDATVGAGGGTPALNSVTACLNIVDEDCERLERYPQWDRGEVEGRGVDGPIEFRRMVKEVKRRVREGRCAGGGSGRVESDCFGWNNFSDAPSLISARSMQQEKSATRKEMIKQKGCRESACHPAGGLLVPEAMTHKRERASRLVRGSRAFVRQMKRPRQN
jgi:hypothetical protein